MKSCRAILVSVTCFLALHGTIARSTHKSKNEDHYMKIENDISNDVPVLPIEGGYKAPEDVASEITYEELRKLYGVDNIYGSDTGYDSGNPYYYYAYNPRIIYDPKSPFYIGNDYDLTNPYPAEYSPDHPLDENEDVPDGTIISDGTSNTAEPSQDEEIFVQTDEPTTEQVEIPEDDPYARFGEPQDELYEANHDSSPNTESYFNNYMMGIPAQLQSFPMFNPEYYQAEYAEYERLAAESEKRQEEIQAQGLDANTVDNPVNFPRGGRSKRGFARMLNLRDRTEDESARIKGKHDKANCGGNNRNNGRRQNPAEDVGNGVADAAGAAQNAAGAAQGAAGTVQNAAGQISGAAGDAVDAASDAAENLRLANNGRRNTRRNGNNNRNNNNRNNNGRRVE